jgi:hypothetical protein
LIAMAGLLALLVFAAYQRAPPARPRPMQHQWPATVKYRVGLAQWAQRGAGAGKLPADY